MSYIAALLAVQGGGESLDGHGAGTVKTDESPPAPPFVGFGSRPLGAFLDFAFPPEWRDGLASLSCMAAPDGMGVARWERLVRDAAALAEGWGELAHGLGWDAVALFGHDPSPIARRLDTAGLAALLDGRPVVALDGAGALILSDDGNRTRFRRQPFPGSINPAVGSVPLWRMGDRNGELRKPRRELDG